MFEAQRSGYLNEGSVTLASEHPLVAAHHFIVATRETGYRSVATAIAELVDNAIQAKATDIQIFVLDQPSRNDGTSADRDITIGVLDNGEGMDHDTLWMALQ